MGRCFKSYSVVLSGALFFSSAKRWSRQRLGSLRLFFSIYTSNRDLVIYNAGSQSQWKVVSPILKVIRYLQSFLHSNVRQMKYFNEYKSRSRTEIITLTSKVSTLASARGNTILLVRSEVIVQRKYRTNSANSGQKIFLFLPLYLFFTPMTLDSTLRLPSPQNLEVLLYCPFTLSVCDNFLSPMVGNLRMLLESTSWKYEMLVCGQGARVCLSRFSNRWRFEVSRWDTIGSMLDWTCTVRRVSSHWINYLLSSR